MFEIPPTDEPAAGAIIFLHGWGANGRDLVPLGQSLGFNNVQLVFLEGECEVPGTIPLQRTDDGPDRCDGVKH